MTNIYQERIAALRNFMKDNNFDAVVIRGNDPHGSEYFPPRYQCVNWLSGFTGEAGDMVVTLDEAGLWTDSRYFIAAVQQLAGTGVDLHKTRQIDSEYIPQFLHRKACTRVCCDSLCESMSSMEQIREACASVPGFELVGMPDLMDVLWQGRPLVPSTPIITLDEESVGMTRLEKIDWLRGYLSENEYFILSSLDEIAWLLNVRASDIDYNPLVISYLLVGQDSLRWFVRKSDSDSLDMDTKDSFELLESEGINIERYDAVFDELRKLVSQGFTICYDPATLNGALGEIVKMSGNPLDSPIPLKKAVKTAAEIEGMREAHLEDGLAMEKFLYWLELQLKSRAVSEREASDKLTALRAEIPGYMGDSFDTISAWGPGGALPHYVTPKDNSTMIQPRGLYLCDSGGQYLFGTTDITRTVPVGETTRLEKEDYTIVLKGMIDLSMAVFPVGTAGCQIDALAREPLWKAGRNFGHGTGHGIGFFLCVHEGPQSMRQNFLQQAFLPGMISSNEPGVYREGMHGVRHENVVLCREAYSTEFGSFLSFETLTSCHIDTSAVLLEMLDEQERQWLNNYNAKVFRNFASASDDTDFVEWLKNKCKAI